MKAVVESLVIRHGTYKIDWMGFALSKKNPLTYHHIRKNCDKGKKTLENGALLSKKGHRFLNFLENNCPELYQEWNLLFEEINRSNLPIDEKEEQKIKTLREKGLHLENKFIYGK